MMEPRFTKQRWMRSALACAIVVSSTGACWPDPDDTEDGCQIVSRSELDCRVEGYEEGNLLDVGLVAYACSGSARPDYDAVLHDGVPEGLLCADKGPLESGEAGYCCTPEDVPCAINTAEECEAGHTGYQCWGNNRPESLNPALLCSNATQERDLYHYCCTGRHEESPCKESASVGCSQRLLGFLCEGDTLPVGENYGANRSRADYFYPMCTTAMEAPNPAFNSYCCYMFLPVPQGGTCVPHPHVPGCEPGRFGFSCYGPDHPEDNFSSIGCPDPGFGGTSHEGYDATLYCCDFI